MAFWNRKPKQRTDEAHAKAVTRAKRMDGWANILSRIGTERDRRIGGDQMYTADPVSVEEAEQLWVGSDLAARVIELLPKETLRRGFELKGFKKEVSEEICADFEEIRLRYWLVRAMQFERAYGGAGLFPVINEGDLEQELNEEGIQRVEGFKLFQPNELYPVKWYSDPRHEKYGEPELYRLQPITVGGVQASNWGVLIHESRLIVFNGIQVTRRQTTGCEYGWGHSVLTRVRAVLRDYEMTWASVASVMDRFSQGILRMQGLAELIAQDADDVVMDRMIQADLGKSVVGSMVLDKEDEFTYISSTLAGVGDVLDRFGTRFAMAADMPVTLALGVSPGGLNATGESDTRFWYDRCDANFEDHIEQIERAARLVILSKDGPVKGKEPEVWSVEKKPSMQPSEKETVDTRKVQMETDKGYYEMGVLTEKTIRENRFGGDTYSIETKVNLAEYAEMDRIAEEAISLEAEAKKAGLEAAAQGLAVTGGQPPPPNGQQPPPPKNGTNGAKKPAEKQDGIDRYWPKGS
jgi:phage-related protein (TIGR01555 family)